VPFQPDMVPSKVSKMNVAGSPAVVAKPCVPFQTVPVGVPWAAPDLEGGIVTTSEITLPVLLYRTYAQRCPEE